MITYMWIGKTYMVLFDNK